jgi:hypothetical protein
MAAVKLTAQMAAGELDAFDADFFGGLGWRIADLALSKAVRSPAEVAFAMLDGEDLVFSAERPAAREVHLAKAAVQAQVSIASSSPSQRAAPRMAGVELHLEVDRRRRGGGMSLAIRSRLVVSLPTLRSAPDHRAGCARDGCRRSASEGAL